MSTQHKRRTKTQTAKKSGSPPKTKGSYHPKAPRTQGGRKQGNVRVLRSKPRARLNVGRIVLLGIFLAFVAWAIYPITYRVEHGRELEQLNSQLAQIKKQNQLLKADLKELSSDDYVEQQARSLGLSRADEEIVVVVPEKPHTPLKNATADAEKNEQNKRSQSFWKRISSWLSGIF